MFEVITAFLGLVLLPLAVASVRNLGAVNDIRSRNDESVSTARFSI